MSANDLQYGGDHYKSHAYEHWDFVCDTGQHYLVGCATKYASRWRRKAGALDLEKCGHYLQKATERGITAPFAPATYGPMIERFCDQLDPNDAQLVRLIMRGEWMLAQEFIKWLIENATAY